MILEVRDISVSYGGIRALTDVSLAVGEGEIVSIIGANGAGKSTMLRTISGLLRPDTGGIFLEGKEMTAKVEPYYLAELRKKAGVGAGDDSGIVIAPMPGLVLQTEVNPGDTVKKGQTLVIIEAMKMENMIKSPHDGKIKDVHVSAGQAVDKNDKLVEFE